jgi:hypothetical protein
MHRHRRSAVLRRRGRCRDDDRDRFADVAHAIGRERMPRRLREWRPVAASDAAAALGDQRGDGADAIGDQVAPGKDVEHARDHARRCGVEREDVGVRVRRAHERGVDLTRCIPVLGVAALPGQQPGILAALDRRTDAEARHELRRPRGISPPAMRPPA